MYLHAAWYVLAAWLTVVRYHANYDMLPQLEYGSISYLVCSSYINWCKTLLGFTYILLVKDAAFFYTSVWDRQTETHTGCYGPVFVLYLYYTYDICKGMSGTAGSYRVICRQFYHDAGSSLFIGIYTVSCMQSDPRQSGGD